MIYQVTVSRTVTLHIEADSAAAAANIAHSDMAREGTKPNGRAHIYTDLGWHVESIEARK